MQAEATVVRREMRRSEVRIVGYNWFEVGFLDVCDIYYIYVVVKFNLYYKLSR